MTDPTMRAALDTLAAIHARDFEVHAARFHSGRDCTRTPRGEVLCLVHGPGAGRWLTTMQAAATPLPRRPRTR